MCPGAVGATSQLVDRAPRDRRCGREALEMTGGPTLAAMTGGQGNPAGVAMGVGTMEEMQLMAMRGSR